MIGEIGRIATAEKMSVEQLQQAYRNKSLPGYIVFPLLEEKMNMQQRMQNAQAMQAQKPPPIADQLMQRANQVQGIEQLPTQLAETQMAHGGIVAFEDGGEVERYQNAGLISEMRVPPDVQRERDKQRKEMITEEYNKAIELGDENLASLYAKELKNLGVVTPVRTPSIKTTPIDGAPPAVGVAAPAGIATPIPKMAAPSAGIAALSAPSDVPGAVVDTGAGESDVSIPTSAMTGDDSNPYEQYINRIRAMTRGSREMSQAEKEYANRTAVSDEDKQRAMWMRALQASLGVLGGRSKYAAENIAAGVSPALQGYMQDVKSQKELETKALGEKAAIARGERLADIQDVYQGLNMYNADMTNRARLAAAAKTTDFKERYNRFLPLVMQHLGVNDPNDPKVQAMTAQAADESAGMASGKADVQAMIASQAQSQQNRRSAETTVGKTLTTPGTAEYITSMKILTGSESFNGKTGEEGASAYKEHLIDEATRRLGSGDYSRSSVLGQISGRSKPGDQSKTEPSTPPKRLLKEGIATQFESGQVWTLENGKPKRLK